MKVSFTAKEFARLLELAYFGQHVLAAYQGPECPAAKRYEEIFQKLLALATPLGCADLVTSGPGGAMDFGPKLMEDEKVEKILSEHTNDAFWHELVARLADRDVSADQARRQLATATPGVEAPLSLEEQVRRREDEYWTEFEKNDLAHVWILRGGQG